jgi:hypothetical protein
MAGAAAIATDGATRLIFAIFAVVFPPLGFCVFAWLLINKPVNLYAPGQSKLKLLLPSTHLCFRQNVPAALTTSDIQLLGVAASAASVEVSQSESFLGIDDESLSDLKESFQRAVVAESVTVDLSQFGLGVVQVPVTENDCR